MKKLILANTLVGEQELRSLAEARAAAVRPFLGEQGEIDPARVVQKSGDIYKGPPKHGTGGSRFAFEVAAESREHGTCGHRSPDYDNRQAHFTEGPFLSPPEDIRVRSLRPGPPIREPGPARTAKAKPRR